MRPLSRRAFFALPVALPVAAVEAAKFAPLIGETGREIVLRRFIPDGYRVTPPGTYLVHAPIDLGQQAVAVARLVNGKVEMATAERAATAAEPVTAQATPAGDTKSCGGTESRRACERLDGESHSTVRAVPKVKNRKVPSGAAEVRTETGAEPEPDVAPGPQDTIASVGV